MRRIYIKISPGRSVMEFLLLVFTVTKSKMMIRSRTFNRKIPDMQRSRQDSCPDSCQCNHFYARYSVKYLILLKFIELCMGT